MGLSVGIVSIEYLDRPPEPIYGFLGDVAATAGWDDDSWGGGFMENAFVEHDHRGLLRKARAYAKEKELPLTDKRSLYRWLRQLPWRGDYIMLHLSW